MKAVVCTKYGPPENLKIRELDKPVPADDEVLVKIHAAGVTASDLYISGSQLSLRYKILMRLALGLTRPRRSVVGLVFAGEIESAGKKIKRFRVGDQVYGLTGFGLGAFAEYKCMKETDSTYGALELKPAGLSYEEATVAAYGGLLAFQSLEKGPVSKGKKILVYGASGTTGTIAVQYASAIGAVVTGVCSTANLEFVRSLGASRVLDYTKDDAVNSLEKYDLVLDAVGKRRTSKLKEAVKRALVPGGKYVSIDDGSLLLDSGRLSRIRDFVESESVKPVVDRCYKLEEIVEAHRYVATGHKRGGVAVTVC